MADAAGRVAVRKCDVMGKKAKGKRKKKKTPTPPKTKNGVKKP